MLGRYFLLPHRIWSITEFSRNLHHIYRFTCLSILYISFLSPHSLCVLNLSNHFLPLFHGQGGFMFIEADEALSGEKAWLMSDRLAASGPHERCLIFWYHMWVSAGIVSTVFCTDACRSCYLMLCVILVVVTDMSKLRIWFGKCSDCY